MTPFTHLVQQAFGIVVGFVLALVGLGLARSSIQDRRAMTLAGKVVASVASAALLALGLWSVHLAVNSF